METRTLTTPSANQMIVTLEDHATVAEIRKALLLIRGVASVERTGIGHPEALVGGNDVTWSHRITVLVIQAESHYNDK